MPAIAATVTLYSGCFLDVLSDSQSAYLFGELNTTVARSAEAVDQAPNLSLEQLHYAKISQVNSLVDARIVARVSPERNITVLIERTGALGTRGCRGG